MAQLGRALGSGPRSRTFKSSHSDHKNTVLVWYGIFIRELVRFDSFCFSENDVHLASEAVGSLFTNGARRVPSNFVAMLRLTPTKKRQAKACRFLVAKVMVIIT